MFLSEGNYGLHMSELSEVDTLKREWDVGVSLLSMQLSEVSLWEGRVLFSLAQSCLPTGLPGLARAIALVCTDSQRVHMKCHRILVYPFFFLFI